MPRAEPALTVVPFPAAKRVSLPALPAAEPERREKITTTVDLAAVAVEAAASLPVGEAEDIAVVMPPR